MEGVSSNFTFTSSLLWITLLSLGSVLSSQNAESTGLCCSLDFRSVVPLPLLQILPLFPHIYGSILLCQSCLTSFCHIHSHNDLSVHICSMSVSISSTHYGLSGLASSLRLASSTGLAQLG